MESVLKEIIAQRADWLNGSAVQLYDPAAEADAE